MKKIIFLFSFFFPLAAIAQLEPPRLVVQLVIDQLRGDLIIRHHQQFGKDGFNYLLAHALDYRSAYHPHANTVTCVGHATIATGSYPSLHGIISNDWYDATTKKSINCVEDIQSKIIPTNRSRVTLPGRSPKNLQASTLSDELVLAQKGRAFAVALKDRSAITLAGHAGHAFWFDKENGGFVTSRYYYQNYPQWVEAWNQRYKPDNQTWELSAPLDSYYYAKAPSFANRFPEFGDSFPHHLGSVETAKYYKYLSITPFADELTTDFALHLLREEKLGLSASQTDYLAIAYAAVDAIGHQFGPNSLEAEDNLRRLDKNLANLLAALDKEVGLEHVLLVLTADHGVTDASVYLAQHRIKEQKELKATVLQNFIEQALAKRFQLPVSSLQAIALPYIYLNHEVIHDHQLSVKAVSHYLAEKLHQQPGIFQAYAIPLSQSDDWLTDKVNKMIFPNRSGDLYLVPPAYQALTDPSLAPVSHGTPWDYDRYVALLFVHPQFKASRLYKRVSTTDIAPTLAALLNIKPPSANVGHPLEEVIARFNNPNSPLPQAGES